MHWQDLGAELVFTQDDSGKYLSFYWQAARDYGLIEEKVLNAFGEETFTPVAKEAYYKKINWVLEQRISEKCYCWFEYLGQFFPFELIISPILCASNKPKSVLVIGHLLSNTEMSFLGEKSLSDHPSNFHYKLLSQITRKIRRTFNLETIWQQTVDSLGEALNVSRCLIVSFDQEREIFKVEAEYHKEPYQSMLGCQFDLESQPLLKQAIFSKVLIAANRIDSDPFLEKSLLAIATLDKNQSNGLIWIQQCDRYRQWSQAEIELVEELADRVGAAIAHAQLYYELEQARIRAEEASRLKSEFLTSTSHELRTPLNGIIGFLKLILEGMTDDPQEQKEFLEEAYRSAIHLLNLINDILDIAKIEAGKTELEFAPVDLDELFRSVENFTYPQAQRKNLSFQVKIPATLTPIVVYANYQRLLQVMLNLVGNAIKFTDEGGVIICAEIRKKKVTYHHQEFPGSVKISVADTGIGVSLEKQERLFENFFQVDGSRTKAYGGTGLGLGISKKLVEAMGGEMSFYSMGEGLGSTVAFSIPLHHLPVMETLPLMSNE